MVEDRLMVMGKPYYYRFEYGDGSSKVVTDFRADVNTEEMRGKLKEFLLASSWTEDIIENQILGDDEE